MDSKLNCNAILFPFNWTHWNRTVGRPKIRQVWKQSWILYKFKFFRSLHVFVVHIATQPIHWQCLISIYAGTVPTNDILSLCVYPHWLPTSTHAAHLIRVRLVLVYTLVNELSTKQWTDSWISNIFNDVLLSQIVRLAAHLQCVNIRLLSEWWTVNVAIK